VGAIRRASHRALVGSRLGSRLLRSGNGKPSSVIEGARLHRRESSLVVDTLYRAFLGRHASPQEQAAMRQRAESGAGIDDLVSDLVMSDEAVNLLMARTGLAARARLRRQFAAGGPGSAGARLVFLHIMKVGGTSLSDTFQQWMEPDRSRVHVYMDDLVMTPVPILAQLRFLAGHIPYAALPLIPGPYSTLCVLRDPYARTISHFTHLRAVRSQFGELTLDEFVTNEVFDVPSSNYQARQLAHEFNPVEAWRSFSPEDLYQARGGDPLEPYPLQSLFDSLPVGYDDDELLQRATNHLADIDYVGVTEDLDAVGAAIARLFDAKFEPIPRLNTSPPIGSDQMDARIRRRIDARTAVDRELYDIAVRRAREQA